MIFGTVSLTKVKMRNSKRIKGMRIRDRMLSKWALTIMQNNKKRQTLWNLTHSINFPWWSKKRLRDKQDRLKLRAIKRRKLVMRKVRRLMMRNKHKMKRRHFLRIRIEWRVMRHRRLRIWKRRKGRKGRKTKRRG